MDIWGLYSHESLTVAKVSSLVLLEVGEGGGGGLDWRSEQEPAEVSAV